MEKLKGAAAIIIIMVMMICVSCTGLYSARNSKADTNSTWANCESADFTEGWCNENTYRVRVTGTPSVKSRTVKERRLSAEKSAINTARDMILGKFKDMGIDISHAEVDTDAYVLANEIRKTVKSGKIISEKWDENQNCEIVYEVSGKRLKKKVMNAVFI